MKKRYGLTKEDYQLLLNKQNNVCVVCKKPFRHKREPFVDHNHKTGMGFVENKTFIKTVLTYLLSMDKDFSEQQKAEKYAQ